MELLSSEEEVYRYGKHHLLERLTEWKKSLCDVAAYSVAPVPLVYTQAWVEKMASCLRRFY